MRPVLPVTAQAIRNGLAMVALPGRFQIVPGQPTLVLDVAHNPHAIAALAENLDAMGFYPGTHAVFGAMADKDLDVRLGKAVEVERMAPLVDHWHLCDLPTPRAATATQLHAQLAALLQTLPARANVGLHTHASPRAALDGAVAAADPTDRIVVFGSFFTVGGVLKDGVPRLGAPHLGS